MRHQSKQNGFTLIEVLVAIVILTIGLLAMASLLTTSISSNTFAREGTEAVELAQEMVDRVRVNAGNTPGMYNGINTGGACGGADPAQGDCTQWQARLQGSRLINATGTVTVTEDSPIAKSARVTVTIQWGAIPSLSRRVTLTTIISTWLS